MSTLLSKVLIIDDDDGIFGSLKPRFDKRGIFLVRARNGEEGITKAKIERPELIITDIMMPRMNGFEMIKQIKAMPMLRDTRIVILSNYGETSLIQNSSFLRSLGIVKYLIKSNRTPTEITKEIVTLLE